MKTYAIVTLATFASLPYVAMATLIIAVYATIIAVYLLSKYGVYLFTNSPELVNRMWDSIDAYFGVDQPPVLQPILLANVSSGHTTLYPEYTYQWDTNEISCEVEADNDIAVYHAEFSTAPQGWTEVEGNEPTANVVADHDVVSSMVFPCNVTRYPVLYTEHSDTADHTNTTTPATALRGLQTDERPLMTEVLADALYPPQQASQSEETVSDERTVADIIATGQICDYSGYTYRELQAECKARSLSGKGKTQELLDRLTLSDMLTTVTDQSSAA